MKHFLNYTALANGYDNTSHMISSIFHPDNFPWMGPLSGFFAIFACVFDGVFGIHVLVGCVLISLFFLEMHTGIKASKLEGVGWDSKKFPKGWFKLGVYAIMVGSMNICSIYIPHKEILGFDINIYSFLHYAFYNYVIISLFLSNIENFVRLGWNMGGFTPWISKRLNLEVFNKHQEKKENNGKD